MTIKQVVSVKPVTLATLQKSTEQEIFDWVVSNLMKQGKQSMYNGHCRYRSDNGKCAAGWIIADEEYQECMDFTANNTGTGWGSLIAYGLVPQHHSRFIQDLQRIHDSSLTEAWPERFRSLATHYELDSSIISQYTS